MSAQDLGKITVTTNGEYDATTTYEKLCMVTYNNKTYISKTTTTGNTPSEDSAYWMLMPSGGHMILDSAGTEMAAEDNLQFGTGLTTTDDSTNEKTVIAIDDSTIATQTELNQTNTNVCDLNLGTATTNTSGSTISSDTYFYSNGQLCKALADIASGATLTLNTNYETVSVGDELSQLNSNNVKYIDYTFENLTADTSYGNLYYTTVYYDSLSSFLSGMMIDYSNLSKLPFIVCHRESTIFFTESQGLIANSVTLRLFYK